MLGGSTKNGAINSALLSNGVSMFSQRRPKVVLIPFLLLFSLCSTSLAQAATKSPAPMTPSQMAKMDHSSTMATPIAQASPAPGGGTFLYQSIPTEVLNTALFDTNGKKISLAMLKGRTIVIADFLTSCQEICPMTSANMRTIGDVVAASKSRNKVTVLEVSVDPWRDSATRLKAYQNLFGDTNWIIAGGSQPNLKKFWDYFGASVEKITYSASDLKGLPVDWQTGKKNTFDVNHTDEIVIVDPKSNWVWLDLGTPNYGKAILPIKLKAFLDAQGISNLAKPEEPSWTPRAVYSALNILLKTKIGA